MNGYWRQPGHPEWPRSRVIGVCRWLLRVASRQVPLLRRPDWLSAWEGELWALARRGASRSELVRYALSSWGEARWERGGGRGVMSGVGQDVRHALRRLGRRPTLTAVIVLVLALGVGVNTALFGALKAVLLERSPYPDAERLVMVDLLLEQRAGAPADTIV